MLLFFLKGKSPTCCSHSVLQLLHSSVQVSAHSELFNQPASTCTLWICRLSSLPNLSLCRFTSTLQGVMRSEPRRPTWTVLLCCTLISIIFSDWTVFSQTEITLQIELERGSSRPSVSAITQQHHCKINKEVKRSKQENWKIKNKLSFKINFKNRPPRTA